jgi:hypothetical protein
MQSRDVFELTESCLRELIAPRISALTSIGGAAAHTWYAFTLKVLQTQLASHPWNENRSAHGMPIRC